MVVKLKLLAITDIHGSPNGNIKTLLKNNNYDLLLIVGDITQFGPVSEADKILSSLDDIDIPVMAVPGNCDPEGVTSVLEDRNVNIHSESKEIKNYRFVGLGGSNPTPFNTPFELSEKEIRNKLNNLTQNVTENLILVTHAPPHGTEANLTKDGTHAGSKSIRKIIKDKKPIANFCGHIHEARSIDKIGKTKIVNPGPVREGFGAEAVLDGKVEINLIKV